MVGGGHAAPPRISGDTTVSLQVTRDPATARVRWERATVPTGPWRTIANARARRYVIAAADAGGFLRACITKPPSRRASCSPASRMIPPRPTQGPAISGTFRIGSPLTAREGRWRGASGTGEWSWEWRTGEGAAWRSAGTGVTFTPRAVGQVRLGQRMRNAGGWSPWSRSRILGVRPAPSVTPNNPVTPVTPQPAPVARTIPSISGTGREGETLTGRDGEWSHSTALSRAWVRCDAVGASCAETGTSAASYALGAADVGATLRLRVTAQGPGGATTVDSAASAVIVAIAPASNGRPTIGGAAVVGSRLDVTPGTWTSNGGPLAYAYLWQRCADAPCTNPVAAQGAGATTASYTPEEADAGSRLRVSVTATDRFGQSATATSIITSMLPPYSPSAAELTGSALVGSDLTLTTSWLGASNVSTTWTRIPYAARALSDGSTAQHACLIRSDGAVACWGANDKGQVGDGTQTLRRSPTLTTVMEADDVATGGAVSCAALADGAVACWGDNGNGQLGSGALGAPESTTPVTVAGISDATRVAVGDAHVCAVRATGTVACWGRGLEGQLGGGTSTSSTTPVDVLDISDAVDVVAGAKFTCALQGSGAVSCWGANDLLQLGNASTTAAEASAPVAVDTASGVTSLAAGAGFACAVQGADAVLCWGDNASGQLGRGAPGTAAAVGAVTGLDGLSAHRVMTMSEAACMQSTSGVIQCWGDNTSGQLATGDTVLRAQPVAMINAPTDAIGFGATSATGFALRSRALAVGWGANGSGQLGADSGEDRATQPRDVMATASQVALPDTAATRTVTAADAGSRVSACSLGSNAGGSSSNCASELTIPPLALRAPAVRGATGVGLIVTADPGAWRGALQYSYQWQTCPDAACTSAQDIPGATSASHTIDPGEVGVYLRVRVTATIGAASATDASPAVYVTT